MRRFRLYSVVLILQLASANAFAGNFTITGVITGTDNTRVYLSYLPDTGNSMITDSANIRYNQFSFTGTIQTPTFGIFYTNSPHIQDYFIFDKGHTAISGDTSQPAGLTVTGSEATFVFNQYKHAADSFNSYRQSLLKFIAEQQAAKDSNLRKQYMDDYYISMSEEENFTEQFISKHHSSYVSAYILYFKFTGESNINKGVAILSTLADSIRQSKYAQLVMQKSGDLRLMSTGMPAAGFSLPDTSGKMIDIAAFKGTYVLVDFWASWCVPCRRENPGLVKAYQQFRNREFEIISISFDENRQRWLSAIHKDGLAWLNVSDLRGWDNSDVAQRYNIQSIPTNFLLDKNGIIIAKNLMGTGLEYELDKLLKEK